MKLNRKLRLKETYNDIVRRLSRFPETRPKSPSAGVNLKIRSHNFPKSWSRYWRPVFGARVFAVFLLIIVGSIKPPTATHAAADNNLFESLARPGSVKILMPSEPMPANSTTGDSTATSSPPAETSPAFDESSPPESNPPPDITPTEPPWSQPKPNELLPSPPTPRKILAGWLPFWDLQEGIRVIKEFPDTLTEVSPFWYKISDDGRIVDSPHAEDRETLDMLHSHGLVVIPTITAAEDQKASIVINDPAKRDTLINQISGRIDQFNYDGVDIDFENLPAGDRDAFSNFIRESASALRAKNKKLIVTVNAKTGETGDWNGAQSQDYGALGKAADYIRVMAYDQHYADGPPGPVAAIDWVDKVVAFTLTKIPKEKVVLGIPAYGYDWPTSGPGKSVVHDEAATISLANRAPVQWDAQAGSPFFKYNDGSTEHTVWFENKQSLEEKVALAKRHNLAGIAIWRLGREDKTGYINLKTLLSETNPKF